MSEAPGLYEKVLEQVAKGADLPAPRPPKHSASVVPWRRTAEGGIQVFWIKRAETMKFMGGWFAFPGGGLSRRDAEIEIEGRPSGVDSAPERAALPEAITDGVADLGPLIPEGLMACALRELFEETGILLQRIGASEPRASQPSPESLEKVRRNLIEREVDFTAAVRGLGAGLDSSALVYAGRWLTPPLGPMRFDNRFFLLEWPPDRPTQPSILPGEIEFGEWVDPADALAKWRRAEVLIAPPIQHILEVLSEDGAEDGLERLRSPVEENLGPFRRIEFRPGVVLFPLSTPTLPPASFTNAYLLGMKEAVLIDPGSSNSREIDWLLRGLAAARTGFGRRVSAIWLTHHHPDHVGGVSALREALKVPVLAHAETAARLAERGIHVDGRLVEGERVVLDADIPFPVRILHTPGHARGHLCFLDETFGSLIAGDMVAGFGTIVIDPPEGSMAEYLHSLSRLREIGPVTLFPAHGPAIKNADEKLEEYIRHRNWREQRVLEAWQSGARTAAEMLPVVYNEVPEVARPLAERQIEAHLVRLRSLGRLESGSDAI